eukprot:6675756-Pyramimonas_sp.AAC.1
MHQWPPHAIVTDLVAMLVPATANMAAPCSAHMAGLAAAVEVLRVLPEEAGRREVRPIPTRQLACKGGTADTN